VGFFVQTFDETLAHVHFDSLSITEIRTRQAGPAGPWKAEYYANQNLGDQPVLSREDASIDFDWGPEAPDPTLPADHFSVRWQATLDLPAGRYLFRTTSDDGVRLLVDGEPVIESWQPMQGSRAGLADLPEGPQTLVLEYFEAEGLALVHLNWTFLGVGTGP
jgi:hypothetical protein